MAKSKVTDAASRAANFLKELKDTDKARLLADSKANVVDFISTGSYSLNRILSGSYFKGIPSNRLVALHGPSSCGKSLIAGCSAREAQKKGYQIIYYDTENAIDKDFCERLGIDYDSVIIRYPETISEFRNMAVSDMKLWREKNGEYPVFLVCDSIGNLMGTKERNDIEAGKDASDMGQRAKELRTCARALTMNCGKFNIPMVVVNHSYEQAASNPMAASQRKMSGGEGFVYSCTMIVELKKSQIKEAEKDAAGKSTKVVRGVILRATTQKNRIVPEGLKAEIYLNFKTGLSKYYGLLNDALEHGFFEKSSTRIVVKHLDKKLFEKHLYKKENLEVWDPILEDLNSSVEKSISFADSIEDDDHAIEELLDDVEEDTEEESSEES